MILLFINRLLPHRVETENYTSVKMKRMNGQLLNSILKFNQIAN